MPGDKIIITSSDLYFDHTETFTILEAQPNGPNTRLKLTTPSKYRHFGGMAKVLIIHGLILNFHQQ